MTQSDDPHEIAADAAVALLATTLPPVAPPSAIRERLMAALRGPERYAPHVPEVALRFGLGESQLRAAFARIDRSEAWMPGLLPNSSMLVVHDEPGRAVVLARLEAGARIPHHRHAVRELTYVLDGELSAGGKRVTRACLLDMPPGSEHAIDVVGDHECLVVFSMPPPSSF